jgi:hypothetical protein
MIAERAKLYSLAARYWLFKARHRGNDPSPSQPCGGVILIVDLDIHEILRVFHEVRRSRYEPGSKAVGVRCNVERCPLPRLARVDEPRQLLEQFAFEHAHIVHVPAEPFAVLRRNAWAASFDQNSPEALFELFHPLGDGGRRHILDARGLFKAAGLDDRRNGPESGIIEPGLVSLNQG